MRYWYSLKTLSRAWSISSSGFSDVSCSRRSLRSGSGLILYILVDYENRSTDNPGNSCRIRQLDVFSWTGPRKLALIDPVKRPTQAHALVPGRLDETC